MTKSFVPNCGDLISFESREKLKYALVLTDRQLNSHTGVYMCCIVTEECKTPNLTVKLKVLENTLYVQCNMVYTLNANCCEFVRQVNLAHLYDVQCKIVQLIGADTALNSLIQK